MILVWSFIKHASQPLANRFSSSFQFLVRFHRNLPAASASLFRCSLHSRAVIANHLLQLLLARLAVHIDSSCTFQVLPDRRWKRIGR